VIGVRLRTPFKFCHSVRTNNLVNTMRGLSPLASHSHLLSLMLWGFPVLSVLRVKGKRVDT